jgi:hypothetical protein
MEYLPITERCWRNLCHVSTLYFAVEGKHPTVILDDGQVYGNTGIERFILLNSTITPCGDQDITAEGDNKLVEMLTEWLGSFYEEWLHSL